MLPPFFFFFFSICASLLCLYSLGLLSLYIFMCVRAISKSPATIFQWALSHLCVYKRGSRDNMMTMAIFSCIKNFPVQSLTLPVWIIMGPFTACCSSNPCDHSAHSHCVISAAVFLLFFGLFRSFFFSFFLNLSRCWLKCSSSFSLPNSH